MKKWLKISFLILLGLFLGSSNLAAAQPITAVKVPGPPPPNSYPADLRLDSSLFYAAQALAEAEAAQEAPLSQADLIAAMQARGLDMDAQGLALVVIEGQEGGMPLSEALVRQFGGRVTNAWRHLLEARLPVSQLANLARQLPPGYFIKNTNNWKTDDVDGEGPARTNSAAYRDNEGGCADLVIGVIDSEWDYMTESTANGDFPPASSRTLIIDDGDFEGPVNSRHGVGVTETVYDHCPDADYRLYKLDSEVDFGDAIDDAIAHNVDVIALSTTWVNTGWADDSGVICTAANLAGESNMLLVHSAGNDGQSHWQGDYNPNGNQWHDFDGGSEVINLSVANGSTARLYLSWDTSGGTYNYDLYLFNQDFSQVLAQGTNTGNTYESVSWTNNTGTTQQVRLSVWGASGGVTEMEVIGWNVTWLDQIHPENSTLSPGNCTDLEVITVGAVAQADFVDPAPALKDYSSRGPSNSGMILPDIVAPTDTSGFAYPTFGGTSCAAPNAAGAIAAFYSASPSLVRSSIRYLILQMASIYKDWGTAGQDNLYGYGGIYLHPYHDNTLWVDRRGVPIDGGGVVVNLWAWTTYPYYYVADAQTAAVSGGRIVFLGQTYSEAITLNKNLLYETMGWPAILGVP